MQNDFVTYYILKILNSQSSEILFTELYKQWQNNHLPPYSSPLFHKRVIRLRNKEYLKINHTATIPRQALLQITFEGKKLFMDLDREFHKQWGNLDEKLAEQTNCNLNIKTPEKNPSPNSITTLSESLHAILNKWIKKLGWDQVGADQIQQLGDAVMDWYYEN